MGQSIWEKNAGALNSRYITALGQDDAAGTGAEAEYRKRALAFDPTKSINDFAKGAYGEVFSSPGGVGDQLTNLKGAAVGAGRLDTGFFDRDQGEVVERGQQDLNSRILGASVQGAGMTLQNNEDIGQYGQNVRSRYLDLLSGGIDRAQADANARAQRKSNFWGGLVKGATSIATAALM
jgi:hypothetical protein